MYELKKYSEREGKKENGCSGNYNTQNVFCNKDSYFIPWAWILTFLT